MTQHSHRGLRVGLLAGGAGAVVVGGVLFATMSCSDGGCAGSIVGGSALLTVGITSMLLSLVMHDTFDVIQSP